MKNYYVFYASTTGVGKAGGLILMWSSHVNLSKNDVNMNFIDCYFDTISMHNMCRFTEIYGHPNHSNKHLTCKILSNLNKFNNLDKWIVCGNFNIVMSSLEKQGATLLILPLLTCLMTLSLITILLIYSIMGTSSCGLTIKGGSNFIQARVDRFLVCNMWIENFHTYNNNHLLRFSSDDNHMLLKFSECQVFRNKSLALIK